MGGKTRAVDRGRGDDQLQIGPARQQLAKVAKQEIDVQAALVRLVDDDRVVAAQHRIALGLGEQDAVGHQLDRRRTRAAILKPHLVAYQFAKRRFELFGHTTRHRTGRKAARLGMRNRLHEPATELQADLGQLGRLARTGLAADDDDLVRGDGARDFLAPCADGQVFGVRHQGALAWGNDNALGLRTRRVLRFGHIF